jgi:hypothetical protein
MKRAETHKYPCWITRDQDGVLTVWRGKGKQHTNDLPPKPKRLRPGTIPVTRIGWIGVEEPKVEDGEGRWILDDFKETTRFRFSKETNKDLFPEVTWEDEPIKGHVSFNIEKD